MRPAQKAPENEAGTMSCLHSLRSFNEAGAKSAGKPDRPPRKGERKCRFNEAGAKSAGKHRRILVAVLVPVRASMRPAQKAPENLYPAVPGSDYTFRFNEAGAKSAGKHAHVGSEDLPTGRFNEAGAKSAGKPVRRPPGPRRHDPASMRPAQKAPENLDRRILEWRPALRFNEAGAKSAGKQESGEGGGSGGQGLQ